MRCGRRPRRPAVAVAGPGPHADLVAHRLAEGAGAGIAEHGGQAAVAQALRDLQRRAAAMAAVDVGAGGEEYPRGLQVIALRRFYERRAAGAGDGIEVRPAWISISRAPVCPAAAAWCTAVRPSASRTSGSPPSSSSDSSAARSPSRAAFWRLSPLAPASSRSASRMRGVGSWTVSLERPALGVALAAGGVRGRPCVAARWMTASRCRWPGPRTGGPSPGPSGRTASMCR